MRENRIRKSPASSARLLRIRRRPRDETSGSLPKQLCDAAKNVASRDGLDFARPHLIAAALCLVNPSLFDVSLVQAFKQALGKKGGILRGKMDYGLSNVFECRGHGVAI